MTIFVHKKKDRNTDSDTVNISEKAIFSGMSGTKKGHAAWETRSEEWELFTTGTKLEESPETIQDNKTKACMGDAME